MWRLRRLLSGVLMAAVAGGCGLLPLLVPGNDVRCTVRLDRGFVVATCLSWSVLDRRLLVV